jgi:predicted PhzF superfamily epimerase YddE/YHI9
MKQSIIQVDAFTDKPFAGNPAAVCVMDEPRDEAWMQNVAREMNLSETAFLHRADDGGFNLRWFTPAVEVELCGHATLASAHALWETGKLRPGEPARFHTKSGLLTCRKLDDGWIAMDFPSRPVARIDPPQGLFESLNATPTFVGRSRLDVLVELPDETAVRALRPDMRKLSQTKARGVIATARASTRPYDFVSRFFAPQSGVDEDPVTGSAHCALAPYWREILGKDKMLAYQASPRGGVVRVELRDDRVLLSGQAVTVLRGELVL